MNVFANRLAALACVTTLAAGGCATMNNTQRGAAAGAGAGGVIGAVIGLTVGHWWERKHRRRRAGRTAHA